MICGIDMGRKGKKKKKTLQQIRDYLNDQSIRIKQISREVFMDAHHCYLHAKMANQKS